MSSSFLSYPSAQHIEAALKSNSIWPEDANQQEYARFQADITAKAAAQLFETETGWGPALALRDEDGALVAETRYFDSGDHNGDLNLKGGLLRLDSVSLGGTLQARDYAPFFHRYTAQSSSTIVSIRRAFRGYGSGTWGSGNAYAMGGNHIAITGVWGLFAEVPADVFLAVQQRAVARMMDLVYNQQSIGSISQDGFSESFDITGVRTQQNIAESGSKDFNTLVTNYMRPFLA